MPSWTFDADEEGWTLPDGWAYNTGLKCLSGDGGTASAGPYLYDLSGTAVATGDPWSVRVRMVGRGGDTPTGAYIRISIYIGVFVAQDIYNDSPYTFVSSTGDSGWLTLSGTLPDTGELLGIDFLYSGETGEYTGYLDSVFINAGVPELRLLKMDADSANLFVTGIEDNDLTLFSCPISSPTLTGTATFGTANYGDPDTFTRGIFPVVAVDDWVYLYGRDGSDRQVLCNLGGVGYVDLGAGTATWATTKFCASLMVAPLNQFDILAAFYDDDIYHSVSGTATQWTKQGDNPNGIRTAACHPTFNNEVLTAGTAAGTIHYSPNWGQSFTHVGGTAIAGTINAIAISRWL